MCPKHSALHSNRNVFPYSLLNHVSRHVGGASMIQQWILEVCVSNYSLRSANFLLTQYRTTRIYTDSINTILSSTICVYIFYSHEHSNQIADAVLYVCVCNYDGMFPWPGILVSIISVCYFRVVVVVAVVKFVWVRRCFFFGQQLRWLNADNNDSSGFFYVSILEIY